MKFDIRGISRVSTETALTGLLLGVAGFTLLDSATLTRTVEIKQQSTEAGEIQYIPVGYRSPTWALNVLLGLSLLGVGSWGVGKYCLVNSDEPDQETPTNTRGNENPYYLPESVSKKLNLTNPGRVSEPVTIRAQLEHPQPTHKNFAIPMMALKHQDEPAIYGTPDPEFSHQEHDPKPAGEPVKPLAFSEKDHVILDRYSSLEDKIQAAVKDMVSALAATRYSLLLAGPMGVGKTFTLWYFIYQFFAQNPGAVIDIVSVKSDRFLGLSSIPGVVHTVDFSGLDDGLEPVFDRVQKALGVMNRRAKLPEELRAQLAPYCLVIDDYYSIYNTISKLSKASADKLASQIGALLTVGRELGVFVILGTHSTVLGDIGLTSKGIRNCMNLWFQGNTVTRESGLVEGSYEFIEASINQHIIQNSDERERLKNLFPDIRGLSEKTSIPMFLNTLGATPTMGLMPDLSWLKGYTLDQGILSQIAKNIKREDHCLVHGYAQTPIKSEEPDNKIVSIVDHKSSKKPASVRDFETLALSQLFNQEQLDYALSFEPLNLYGGKDLDAVKLWEGIKNCRLLRMDEPAMVLTIFGVMQAQAGDYIKSIALIRKVEDHIRKHQIA